MNKFNEAYSTAINLFDKIEDEHGYLHILDLLMKFKLEEVDANDLFEKVSLCYKVGKRYTLSDTFKKAIKLDPGNWIAHFFMAQEYAGDGFTDEIVKHMSKAKELNPELEISFKQTRNQGKYTLHHTGEAFDQLGMAKEALECAETLVLDQNEKHLGLRLFMSFRNTDCDYTKYFKKIPEKTKGAKSGWILMDDVKHALSKNPKNWIAQYFLIENLVRDGKTTLVYNRNFDEIVKAVEKLYKLKPDFIWTDHKIEEYEDASFYFTIAKALRKTSEEKDFSAMHLLEEILASEPGRYFSGVWNELIDVRNSQKHHDWAVNTGRDALKNISEKIAGKIFYNEEDYQGSTHYHLARSHLLRYFSKKEKSDKKDLNKCIKYADTAIELAKEQSSDIFLEISYHYKGAAHINRKDEEDIEKAIESFENRLEILKKWKKKDVPDLDERLGSTYYALACSKSLANKGYKRNLKSAIIRNPMHAKNARKDEYFKEDWNKDWFIGMTKS